MHRSLEDDENRMNWDAFQPINILQYNTSAHSADTTGIHFGTVDSCARQDVDWLILLEDDVWVWQDRKPKH